MILIIDNYDSFVHNLARYIRELGCATAVFRNDEITVAEVVKMKPDKIVISPGPCDPNRAGVSLQVINELGASIPILGVCLGHQAIGQAYGGKVIKARMPFHGKASVITHSGMGIFRDIVNLLSVGRYHSLIIEKDTLPPSLQITAESENGEIMAIQHKDYPVFGVQFHPESVNTKQGHVLLNNFLKVR